MLENLELPLYVDDPLAFKSVMKQKLYMEEFNLANMGRARATPVLWTTLAPLISSRTLSRKALHQGVLWYLGKLPVRTDALWPLVPELRRVLDQKSWTTSLESNASEVLEKCLALRDLH